MNSKSNSLWLRIVLVTFFVIAMTFNGAGYAADRVPLQLMQPSAPVAAAAYSAEYAAQEPSEPHSSRRGRVTINTAIFEQALIHTDIEREAAPDLSVQQLLLSFFSGKDFSITVDSATRSKNNILNVRGTVGAHPISSFTMTIGPDSYLLTLQDLDSTFVYRVVGDMGTGVGEVQEIDLSKMPAIYDSEPVVRP